MTTQPDNSSSVHNPVGRFMVAAGAVIEHRQTGKLLLIQRAPELDWHPGEWELIYGRIDQFESVQEGLAREVREETGITELEVAATLSVWHIFRGPVTAENEVIGITFRCLTGQTTPQLSSEHIAYRWVTVEEALQLIQVPGIRRDVERYRQLQRAAR